MKKMLPLLFLIPAFALRAQQRINLPDCYQLAIENYPLSKQKNLIQEAESYSIKLLNSNLIPQLSLNGQATTQSEVTKINIPLPNVSIPTPSHEQYKITLDFAQPITDLFTAKDQRKVIQQNTSTQQSSTEVELYKLRDRINQLYFSAYMLNEQLHLNELVDKDLETAKRRVEAAIKNGVDYKSSLDKISAQLILNRQKRIEISAQKLGVLSMLSKFIQQALPENVELEKPDEIVTQQNITRPELSYFSNKALTSESQIKTIKNKSIPKVSLFGQAGIGQPSPLNFLNTQLKPFAIGGIKLNWNFNSLYTKHSELNQLKLEMKNNDLQKDLFLWNTQQNLALQTSEIEKLKGLLETDDELIKLRTSIKQTSDVQLANGVITASDFIREVNAEDQARQSKLLHQIQLLQAKYNQQFIQGNN